MKEENGSQDVGATAFDYPTGQHPGYENKIYHGNQRVPHPTNSAAKITPAAEVRRATLEAKYCNVKVVIIHIVKWFIRVTMKIEMLLLVDASAYVVVCVLQRLRI